jgi:hypothetical protein
MEQHRTSGDRTVSIDRPDRSAWKSWIEHLGVDNWHRLVETDWTGQVSPISNLYRTEKTGQPGYGRKGRDHVGLQMGLREDEKYARVRTIQ